MSPRCLHKYMDTNMNSDDLRSKQDIEISRQLMETKEVKRVNEMIEKREQEGPMGYSPSPAGNFCSPEPQYGSLAA